MTVTLLALDGSLWECEVKTETSPSAVVFSTRVFIRRSPNHFDLVYKEVDAARTHQISKPRELGE